MMRTPVRWMFGPVPVGVQIATAIALAAGASLTVRAAEPNRAEQHVFDEQTGEWVPARQPVAGTEDGDLDIARQQMARDEYKRALRGIEAWIKTYGPDSPRYAEALYLKGTALLERGHYRESHDTYQSLLNDFPASDYAEKALAGEFRVAEQYLAGKKKRIWGGLLRLKDRDAGIEILNDIIANYSDTPYAEMAQMAKGDYYFSRGEFELAESEYALFAREYTTSRWHSRALLMSAQSALARFPGIKFDDAALVEAEERFRQFSRAHPGVAAEHDTPVILEQISATRADKTLSIARFYEKTDELQAARYYYRAVSDRWPDTPAAQEAAARLAALQELSSESQDGSPAEAG